MKKKNADVIKIAGITSFNAIFAYDEFKMATS